MIKILRKRNIFEKKHLQQFAYTFAKSFKEMSLKEEDWKKISFQSCPQILGLTGLTWSTFDF